jgi:hypothetical protein
MWSVTGELVGKRVSYTRPQQRTTWSSTHARTHPPTPPRPPRPPRTARARRATQVRAQELRACYREAAAAVRPLEPGYKASMDKVKVRWRDAGAAHLRVCVCVCLHVCVCVCGVCVRA